VPENIPVLTINEFATGLGSKKFIVNMELGLKRIAVGLFQKIHPHNKFNIRTPVKLSRHPA
jgi:hypothetical protein